MIRNIGALCTIWLLAAAAPTIAAAQDAVQRFETWDAEVETAQVQLPSGWRPVRVAKWSTLALSVAAAGYGFVEQRSADREYETLERLCQEDLARCGERLPNGAFADPELERRYQTVVKRDRNARASLVASQVAVVSSVVLFVLDLRDHGDPPNVPYEPPLRFGVAEDGGVDVRVRFALGGAP